MFRNSPSTYYIILLIHRSVFDCYPDLFTDFRSFCSLTGRDIVSLGGWKSSDRGKILAHFWNIKATLIIRTVEYIHDFPVLEIWQVYYLLHLFISREVARYPKWLVGAWPKSIGRRRNLAWRWFTNSLVDGEIQRAESRLG